MRILVTGADGFVGRHLCRHLEEVGDQVIAAYGPSADATQTDRVDLTSQASALALIERAKPDAVIHLAGFSSVAKSHQEPGRAFSVNTLGTVHVLSALRTVVPSARVLLIGSGEVYGAVAPGTQADETHAVQPLTPYAASKAAAELVGLQFWRGYRLPVIATRPFNHLGPGQDPGFVVPSFARQVNAIRSGEAAAVIRTGNLEAIRDFSHVSDVVVAYRLLIEKGEPGQAYNVCSGQGRPIQSLLDELIALGGIEARIELDPERMRPAEIPSLIGNPRALEALGWKRRFTVTDALKQVLDETRTLSKTAQPSASR
jgi:GDP-4-dehydro-6-deoxy-D-mannose reductase